VVLQSCPSGIYFRGLSMVGVRLEAGEEEAM
jgi:hypothetical protein